MFRPAAFHLGDEQHVEFNLRAFTAQGWVVSDPIYFSECIYIFFVVEAVMAASYDRC